MYYKNINNPSKQHGVALLAAVLVLLVASSYLLLRKLNIEVAEYPRRAANLAVMNEAKEALIGYAINYSLRSVSGSGPGRLPCPDRNQNGSAQSNCAALTGATIGLFPFRTLETDNFRDHHGERLWYRVDYNYRSRAEIVNSNTESNLTVGNTSDIVAILYAPGAPVAGQNRAGDLLNVANYLEDDNEPNFNDTLVTITRQELMAVVEKRVLGDIETVVKDSQRRDGAYPQLSPFFDDAVFSTGVIRRGRLPVHEQGETFKTDTSIADTTISWDISGGIPAQLMVSGTINEQCLRDIMSTCGSDEDNRDQEKFLVLDELPIPTPAEGSAEYPEFSNRSDEDKDKDKIVTCTWGNITMIDCEPITAQRQRPVITADGVTCGYIIRTYTLVLPKFEGTYGVKSPTVDKPVRTYNVRLFAEDLEDDQPGEIRIKEEFVVPLGIGCTAPPYQEGSIGEGTLYLLNATSVTLMITGIQYNLDPDGYDYNGDDDFDDTDIFGNNEREPDLPDWFVEDGWDELIYIAYAEEALPGKQGEAPCTEDPSPCLSVRIGNRPNQTNDNRAVIISPGITLPTQDRPADNRDLSNYFEAENVDNDNVFEKRKRMVDYNDQTRSIID